MSQISITRLEWVWDTKSRILSVISVVWLFVLVSLYMFNQEPFTSSEWCHRQHRAQLVRLLEACSAAPSETLIESPKLCLTAQLKSLIFQRAAKRSFLSSSIVCLAQFVDLKKMILTIFVVIARCVAVIQWQLVYQMLTWKGFFHTCLWNGEYI